ncbi:MAG: GIY-YIG nuclease family protein [Candidatus Omnitrophica bacterium]|nr:GIY-YIG nuclease family protein [Candidatus Omnitrophota bacterium]
MSWYVYVIECSDSLLYTGVTKDLQRRVKEHNSGYGCRFTRYRAPVKLVHSEEVESRPQALIREAEIKRFPRAKKLKLFNGD